MELEYEGKTYKFDLDDLDIKQSLMIEEHIDGTILDFETGLAKGRTVCFQALGWAVLHGADTATPITSVNFKLGQLLKAFFAAVEAEQAKEAAAAGPTVAAASTGRKSARASLPSG